MQQPDRPKFAQLLTGIAEYYRYELSAPVIGFYWRALARFEIGDIERAVDAHIQCPDRGQFMPRIANLVERLEGTAKARAQDAWTSVVGAIRAVGGYRSVVFDDPRIHMVIDTMGGWPKLCWHDHKEMVFRQAEFCSRYEGIAMASVADRTFPSVLSGEFDTYNSAHGHLEQVKRPAMIGNEAKCKEVMALGCVKSGPLAIGDLMANLTRSPLPSAST